MKCKHFFTEHAWIYRLLLEVNISTGKMCNKCPYYSIALDCWWALQWPVSNKNLPYVKILVNYKKNWLWWKMFYITTVNSLTAFLGALNINICDATINMDIYRKHTCKMAGLHYLPDHPNELKSGCIWIFYWTVPIIWQSETQRQGIQNNHPNSHKLIYQCYDKLYNNTPKISHVKSHVRWQGWSSLFKYLFGKITNKPYRKTNIKSTYIYEHACVDCKFIFKRIR